MFGLHLYVWVPLGDPDKTQSEHAHQISTASFLQQLTFPQHAHFERLTRQGSRQKPTAR